MKLHLIDEMLVVLVRCLGCDKYLEEGYIEQPKGSGKNYCLACANKNLAAAGFLFKFKQIVNTTNNTIDLKNEQMFQTSIY
jgi:hypothetical protein